MSLQNQFNQFLAKYNGQPVEIEDPSNLDQCFDLAFAWVDFINVPRETIRHLNAYQIWTQPLDATLQYFDYLPNTPNGVPQAGDIVVFGQGVGAAGHVCIASGQGDANGFQSLDQNWSGVQYARLVNHVYTSVLGWLHLKTPSVTDPVLIAQSDAFIALCTLLNVAANKDLALAEIEKLITIEDQTPAKDKQLQDAQKQITELEAKLVALQSDHDSLTAEIAVQAKTIQDQDIQIKDLSTSLQGLKSQSTAPILTGWKKSIFDFIVKI